MGQYTNFIKLFKPDETERYDINVFNENADLIDSALEQLEKKNESQKEYTDEQITALADGQVTANKNDIASLQEKVKTLESVTYVPINETQISALFEE